MNRPVPSWFGVRMVGDLFFMPLAAFQHRKGGTSLSVAKGVFSRAITPFATLRDVPPKIRQPILTRRPTGLTSGYTLVEILVATTLSLLLLVAVIQMFGKVGEGITDSRAMLESADRLRVVQARLQQDLSGITVTMNPPCRPEDNAGYFEYIEGPITQANASNYAVDSDTGNPDTTVGDFDDILMFTTRSTGRPFVGKCITAPGGAIQSDVAEVAWFLRGRTLYRRVLLSFCC